MSSPRDQLEDGVSTAGGDRAGSFLDRGNSSWLGATADRWVRFSDLVNRVAMAAAMLILAVMLFIAVWGVVARFILQNSLSWNEEADSYLFIWLTFIGAAAGYKERGHPTVLILVRLAPPGIQRAVLVLTHLVVVTLCGILFVYGLQLIGSVGTTTASSFDMPMTYAYLALPVGSVMIAIHALANATQDIEHPTLTLTAEE